MLYSILSLGLISLLGVSASPVSQQTSVVTASGTTSTITNTNPSTTILATATATNFGLNDAAKAKGKLWFGTAADIPGAERKDKYYMAEFNNTHDFGEATPANIMKVSPTFQQFNQSLQLILTLSTSSCTPNHNPTNSTSKAQTPF